MRRTTGYEHAGIRFHHHEVIRPDGQPGVYGVVAFRSAAVGVVALDDRRRILLVGQFRYTLDEYSWEIPEGGVPHDELPLDGAKRELAEETGYTASEWRELLRLATSNSVTDEVGVVFVARGLTAGEAHPDGTEQLRLRWVSLGDAVRMVDEGEITDAMSQVAILRIALAQAAGEAGVRSGSASGRKRNR
jgi:8-oxo-dGTP pyrophosphatase MutT (NUDIX family)